MQYKYKNSKLEKKMQNLRKNKRYNDYLLTNDEYLY